MKINRRDLQCLTALKMLGYRYMARDSQSKLWAFVNKPIFFETGYYESEGKNSMLGNGKQEVDEDLLLRVAELTCMKIDKILGGE